MDEIWNQEITVITLGGDTQEVARGGEEEQMRGKIRELGFGRSKLSGNTRFGEQESLNLPCECMNTAL